MSLRPTLLAVTCAVALGGCATFSGDGGLTKVETLARERTGVSATLPHGEAGKDRARMRVAWLLELTLSADSAVEVALLNNPGFRARLAEPASAEFEEAQYRLAADAVQLAAETRRAFFAAVAAQQSVTYFAEVQMAAETAAELARRLQQAGNFSALARMREQAFSADAAAQLARAKQAAVTERERLTRLLGLWGSGTAFTLPPHLPEMPAAPRELGDAERTALEMRLDVLASRHVSEAAAAAFERTRKVAINARSEVRESYHAYRTAYDLAKHYRDEIVPLRRKIADEMLLRYNGMLIGVFELIADAREQVASVHLSIQALRDFWLADTDLQLALIGGARGTGALRLGTGAMSAPGVEAGH